MAMPVHRVANVRTAAEYRKSQTLAYRSARLPPKGISISRTTADTAKRPPSSARRFDSASDQESANAKMPSARTENMVAAARVYSPVDRLFGTARSSPGELPSRSHTNQLARFVMDEVERSHRATSELFHARIRLRSKLEELAFYG